MVLGVEVLVLGQSMPCSNAKTQKSGGDDDADDDADDDDGDDEGNNGESVQQHRLNSKGARAGPYPPAPPPPPGPGACALPQKASPSHPLLMSAASHPSTPTPPPTN